MTPNQIITTAEKVLFIVAAIGFLQKNTSNKNKFCFVFIKARKNTHNAFEFR